MVHQKVLWRPLKSFIKPFEAPRRSGKIKKFNLIFFSSSGIGTGSVKKYRNHLVAHLLKWLSDVMRNKCQKKSYNNNSICFCLWCYKQSKNFSNSIWESVTSPWRAEYKTLRLNQWKYLTARSKNPKKSWTKKNKLHVLHEFLWLINSLDPFSVPRLLLPYP